MTRTRCVHRLRIAEGAIISEDFYARERTIRIRPANN
jgi:hypothetical protein